MALTCWDCGGDGHVAAACPNRPEIGEDGKPAWCGTCDEMTRLIDAGDKMRRCGRCHPLRGRMLAQHRRCPSCGELVYSWEHGPCGHHQPVGRQLEHIDVAARSRPRDAGSLQLLAAAQVAEARTAHGPDLDAWLALPDHSPSLPSVMLLEYGVMMITWESRLHRLRSAVYMR